MLFRSIFFNILTSLIIDSFRKLSKLCLLVNAEGMSKCFNDLTHYIRWRKLGKDMGFYIIFPLKGRQRTARGVAFLRILGKHFNLFINHTTST